MPLEVAAHPPAKRPEILRPQRVVRRDELPIEGAGRRARVPAPVSVPNPVAPAEHDTLPAHNAKADAPRSPEPKPSVGRQPGTEPPVADTLPVQPAQPDMVAAPPAPTKNNETASKAAPASARRPPPVAAQPAPGPDASHRPSGTRAPEEQRAPPARKAPKETAPRPRPVAAPVAAPPSPRAKPPVVAPSQQDTPPPVAAATAEPRRAQTPKKARAPVAPPPRIAGTATKKPPTLPAKYQVLGAMLIDGLLAGVPALTFALALAEVPDVPLLFAAVGGIILSPQSLVALVVFTVVISLVQHTLVYSALGGTVGGRLFGVSWRRGEEAGVPTSRRVLRGVLAPVFAILFMVGPLYALWLSAAHRGPADALAGVRPSRRGAS